VGHVAAIEPDWTRFAVPLLGVVGFAVAATWKQRRSPSMISVVVLTALLGSWLFGVGLVWSKRWPSMIRAGDGWSADPNAWEWTALLVLAFTSVLAAGISLRSYSGAHKTRGWASATIAAATFAAWSAVVRYSLILAITLGCVAVMALGWSSVSGAEPSGFASVPNRSRARALVIVALTVLGLAALGILIASQVPTD